LRREKFDHRGERAQHEALHVRADHPHRGSVLHGTYGGCTAYDMSMPTPARTIAVSATPLAGVSAAEWERLLAANPTVSAFSNRAVHAAWWSAHSDTAQDVSLAARDAASNELLGYLPLMKRPDGVIYSGATFHIDYATVLLEQISPGTGDDVAAALADALVRTNAPLNLLRLRNEDAAHARMISAITRAAEANNRTATFGVEEPAPFIDLVGITTFDEHLERLDKKERHEIRRKLRRAEAAGVQISASTDLVTDLPEFIWLHRARWGESGLFTATEKGTSEERFMREIFSSAPAGMITLLLARNEEFGTFAAGLFLRDANALRYWNAGGDIAARALSPGVLLFAHGLTMAISEKLPRLDFLRGNEAYKYECGAVDAQVMQLQVPA
jgi:CelD/BcsL family acetyltransferase involved in cellulose biosynthesis